MADVPQAAPVAPPPPQPPPAPEPVDALSMLREERKRQLQGAMFVAKNTEPDRRARALELSKKFHVRPDFIERHMDRFEKAAEAEPDLDRLLDRNPGLSKWFTDPDNAALGKDDIPSLSKAEDAVRRLIPQKPEPFGYGGALKTGWENLTSSIFTLAPAFGFADTTSAAEAFVQARQRAKQLRETAPNYKKKWDQLVEKEGGDIDRAWDQFTGSFDQMRRGNILNGLKQFASGGGMTVAETLDFLYEAGPKSAAAWGYMNLENMANQLPSYAASAVGAGVGALTLGAAGAKLGAPLGPFGATAGMVAGVAKGLFTGYLAGNFIGQLPVEMGAWISEELEKKGVDTTNVEQVDAAFKDQALMARLRNEGLAKGLSIATLDTAFAALGAKFISGGVSTSLARKLGRGALVAGADAVQEGASEGAGQFAARSLSKPPLDALKAIDAKEVVMEALGSLGHSVGQTAATAGVASMRKALSADTAKAAMELAEQAEAAVTALGKTASLVEAAKAVRESKTLQRSKEKVRELIEAVTDGEPTAVFFQTDEWDAYWKQRGESPLVQAQTLLGDGGKAYTDAKEAGHALEIPMATYLSEIAPTEHFEGLLPVTRAEVGGMSFEQGRETLQALPATMEELAKEAAAEADVTPEAAPVPKAAKKAPSKEVETKAKEVGKRIEEQLKAAGRSAEESRLAAGLVSSAYRALGTRLGDEGKALLERFWIQVRGPEEAAAAVDGQTIEQTSVREFPQKVTRAASPSPDVERPRTFSQSQLSETEIEKGFTLFQEGKDDPNARITFGRHSVLIDLLKNANPSSFIHELGHFYLEILGDAAALENTPGDVKADYQTVLDWLGVKDRSEIKKEHHEKWARGFEKYVAEAEAPSSALREAFEKFKTWLIAVYRDLRNLRVELTPEVRAVMDRLVATQQEIDEAKATFEPLFADPEAFGMTGKKAQAYRKAQDEQVRHAKEKLTRQVMKELEERRSIEYEAERERIRFEVEAEVNAMPVYRAWSGITRGENPDGSPLQGGAVRLSTEGVRAIYGFKTIPENIRALGLTKKDGIHPDIVADGFGFRSGKEMVDAIAQAIPREQLIEQLTEQRMQVERPELVRDPARLRAEAEAALRNDPRSEVLKLELEHLASNDMPLLKDAIRRVSRRVPTVKAVRAQAARTIGGQKIQSLRPDIYERAERKAAKEAGEALAKGDLEAAFNAKRRELLNHELFRAAKEARESIAKAKKEFRRFERKDEDLSKTRDMGLVNAARATLAKFGLMRPTEKTAEEYLAPHREYDKADDRYQVIRALYESATQRTGDLSEITFDDFVSMKNAVDAMWDLSRDVRTIEIQGRREELADVRKRLVEQILDMVKQPEDGKRAGYDRATTRWDKFKRNLMGARAALRRVEHWSEAMGEDFVRYVWRPIAEAADLFRDEKAKVVKRYRELLKPIEKDLKDRAGVKILAPELGVRGYEFRDKAHLLGAMIHIGNLSNKSKLVLGMKWGERDQQGNADFSKWEAFRSRMEDEGVITKADYEFLQSVWDLFEEMKPQAQRVHKKLYGFYFSEVTADQVETRYGAFRGGYAPAIPDTLLVEDAALHQDKENIEKLGNSFMFPTAGRGFTKKRIEDYTVPLLMDLKIVPQQLDKVLRFVHLEPAVRDVGKLVTDRDFRAALAQLDPEVAQVMLVPWLQRAARQSVEEPGSKEFGFSANFFRKVRATSGMQVMFGNISNAMQQFTGYSVSAVLVEEKRLLEAQVRYLKNPRRTAEGIAEKSVMMRNRMDQQVSAMRGELNEILLNPSLLERSQEWAGRNAYFLQSAAQNIIDMVTWMAAYDQAIDLDGAPEPEAVAFADGVVRRTQGSMLPEDVSRFEAGPAFVRLFTMFTTYFNTIANLQVTEQGKIFRELGLQKGALPAAFVYVKGMAIPAFVSGLIVQIMAGKGFDADDDESYLDDFFRLFFGEQFSSFAATVPVVGQVAAVAQGATTPQTYDDRFRLSPAIQLAETAIAGTIRTAGRVAEGEGIDKRGVRDTLSLLGLITRLPLQPLSKPISYMMDVEEGRAQPTGPIDFARGLVTGRPGGPDQR